MIGKETFSGIDVTTSCYVMVVNRKVHRKVDQMIGELRDDATVVRAFASGQSQSCFAI